MTISRIVELRLTAFKSFNGSVLAIGNTTILTGRNSSGKSNALDGLEVLGRLASGDDLVEALDGRRRAGGPIRGGSQGCAPDGSRRFALGCSVEVEDDRYDWDIEVEVSPDVKIVSERLVGPAAALRSGKISNQVLFETRPTLSGGVGIDAVVHNGKRGPNPPRPFRDTRILAHQLAQGLAGINPAEASVVRGAEAVLLALRGVFHLDPVPHLMRDFTPGRDVELRRTGENVSAALRELKDADQAAFARLFELVQRIADENVVDIKFVSSDLGDVMLALEERRGPVTAPTVLTPARQMSDGLLRQIAVATALLSPQHGLDVDTVSTSALTTDHSSTVRGGILLVVEEIENGLHPSQARTVLNLIRESSEALGVRVLFTTHSPAMLDAVEGVLNDHVVVCHRDSIDGRSVLTPLVKLPMYARALAEGSLGDAVSAGKLTTEEVPAANYAEFERLLGL